MLRAVCQFLGNGGVGCKAELQKEVGSRCSMSPPVCSMPQQWSTAGEGYMNPSSRETYKQKGQRNTCFHTKKF